MDVADSRWDPVRGSLAPGAVPLNISPGAYFLLVAQLPFAPELTSGLIHVLRDMLQRSASSGLTRSAVLARDGVHIKGSFGFDSSEFDTRNRTHTSLGMRLPQCVNGDRDDADARHLPVRL